MTIHILSNDAQECAKILDDQSLGEMISESAQYLCNVHWCFVDINSAKAVEKAKNSIPLEPQDNYYEREWSVWLRSCLANYNFLLAYARANCDEYAIRFREEFTNEENQRVTRYKPHKHHDVIAWCSENLPDLPMLKPGYRKSSAFMDNRDMIKPTPMPLVMPEKYLVRMPCQHNLGDGSFFQIKQHFFDFDIIESYRAYYKAKLRKKKVEKHIGIGDIPYAIHRPVKHTWTRREIPEFLGDL